MNTVDRAVIDAAMRRALRLAAAHRPHPNPRVGAVVLDAQGRVVGEGAHVGAGAPHAERVALDRAGGAARGGTLVVTLEPCNHTGRTPPCTEAIVAAGVARVVVGCGDPDPRVKGSGLNRLRDQGIAVELWEAPEEAENLDRAYFHHRRTGRPLVVHKAALTLDGQTAGADGSSRWITCEEARRDAHRLRAEVDAVMVGAGTLIADDPRLDVRLEGYRGPQPRPVIVAGRRSLPVDAVIWGRNPLVLAPSGRELPAGDLLVVPGPDGRVDLRRALRMLGELGLLSVLVEGGSGLVASLWEAESIDRGVWYVAAKIAGGGGRGVFEGCFPTVEAARKVRIVNLRRVGSDLRIEWETCSPE